MSTLVIGDLVIPDIASLGINCNFNDLRGDSFERTADGTAVHDVTWSDKLALTASHKGWVPCPLTGLDKAVKHVVKSAVPRMVLVTGNVASLPVKRRSGTGYQPTAFGIVNGKFIDTGITLSGDTATADLVDGAVSYAFYFYPQFTATIAVTADDYDIAANEYAWSFTAQEA